MSTDEPHQAEHDREVRESVSMEISNAMVRPYKEQLGRGPTTARTHWCSDNTIVVLLEDTLTPAERISGIDTECDGLSTELFVLHREGYEGPSRAERSEL